MDGRRLLIGSLVGGVVVAGAGFLLYELLLGPFFDSHTLVAMRPTPVVWAMVVGALAHGLFLTLILGWTNTSSVAAAFTTGAVTGLLVWFGADMILLALMEISTATGALADSAVAVIQYGIAGVAVHAIAGGRGAPTGSA